MSINSAKQAHALHMNKMEEELEAQKTRIRSLEQLQNKLNQAFERRYAQYDVIQKAQLFFIFTDLSLRITYASPNIDNLLKHGANQLKGQLLSDYIHPDDMVQTAQSWRQSIKDGRLNVEFRAGHSDSGFRWVMSIVVPQLSGARCEMLQAVLMDIDARKQAEKKVADDEIKYRKIIESIQEGYFETDLDGRITFCNKALLHLSGYKHHELIGKTFRDVAAPRTVRIMQTTFGKVLKTGREASVSNYEVFHKSGHTLIIEFAAGLRLNQQDEPIGFHGILRDVSDQIKALEKQKQIQSQRNQVKKMDALGTLAGGLAHGFNNVLMAIQGNLSLIRMNLSADHPMQKHLERINQSTEKGSQLAREILSFAKIGKFVVMPTNLNKILKSTSRMFVRANSKLKIHELYQDELWKTYVDRVQIGQVLLSLFMNAAEAMPNGGDLYLQSENVTLDESYTRPFDAKPGRYIKISVTDSGPGLDDETKQRIFEPFFTAYRPLRYDGLGLAATYGTVKSHNGIINVYSEKEHGTTFTIYLPAAVSESPQATGTKESARGNETILLVDDDEIAARLGRDILERYGYRIMVASSGGEAVEVYDAYQDQIQLVLLDMILPDGNGEQVYMELQRRNPNVLVVLASGYNVNKHIQALLNIGCIDFVQKPFQSKLLSEKIRLALDKKHLSPAIRSQLP
jgi:PAS domain S-box-containing protein